MHSIIKALYGDNTGYEAICVKVCKYDKSMLDITVAHPSLPTWQPGKKLPHVNITRRYEHKE